MFQMSDPNTAPIRYSEMTQNCSSVTSILPNFSVPVDRCRK